MKKIDETLLGVPILDFFWATLVMASLLFLLLICILLFLIIKMRSSNLRKFWKGIVAEIIYEAASADDDTFEPNSSFKAQMSNPRFCRYVARSLVSASTSLSGVASKNLQTLYKRLNLANDSLSRLSHTQGYVIATAIQELTTMHVVESEPKIAVLLHHRQEIIRLEAQYGLVKLRGFAGLGFLKTLSKPISDWQQLKLLSAINHLPDKVENQIRAWLEVPNDSVVVFTLKLITKFQLFTLHDDILSKVCSASSPVKLQILKTLTRIARPDTATAIIKCYNGSSPVFKIQALSSLQQIGNMDHVNFLLKELTDGDNSRIRLNAARAILGCSAQGVSILERAARHQSHYSLNELIDQANEEYQR